MLTRRLSRAIPSCFQTRLHQHKLLQRRDFWIAGFPEGAEITDGLDKLKKEYTDKGIDQFVSTINMSIAKMKNELNCDQFDLTATANLGIFNLTITTHNNKVVSKKK